MDGTFGHTSFIVILIALQLSGRAWGYMQRRPLSVLALLTSFLAVAWQSSSAQTVSDKASQRYSPLSQIGRDAADKLEVAWQRPGVDGSVLTKLPDLSPSNYLRGTPLFVKGVLYASDSVGLVEAFDALTGKTLWVQQPLDNTLKEAIGLNVRLLAHWEHGADERIISIRSQFLYALDARTGKSIKSFGDEGRVFLRWPTNDPVTYWNSAGPVVVNDVIVVGGVGGARNVGDEGDEREGYPENIRAYDARTGNLLWTFHVAPRNGEPGAESWGNGSNRYVGSMGAWAPISADEHSNTVYVPLSAPTVSYYGGHRPGNNVYSDSIVAIDTKTGHRKWSFQLVHHDLWDYDTASSPVLGQVKVAGKSIDAVMQVNKPGFLYVFNRETGLPIWPIREIPVPQSTVPGEVTSPTQPVPTQFPPIIANGITEDELIDFTPGLREEAKAFASHYVTGPVFTPPSLVENGPDGKRGTLALPGGWGSGNWNTGAFDPETHIYYAVARKEPSIYGLSKPANPSATLRFTIMAPGVDDQPPTPGAADKPPLLSSGLPIVKPPYGQITAYKIDTGQVAWTAPNGDDPAVRVNPVLKSIKLPDLLGNTGRAAPLVTKAALFLADASDAVFGAGIHTGAKLRAYDKVTGQVMWSFPLPVGATGAPMTYEIGGRQYLIIPVGGSDYPAGSGWIALALKK